MEDPEAVDAKVQRIDQKVDKSVILLYNNYYARVKTIRVATDWAIFHYPFGHPCTANTKDNTKG